VKLDITFANEVRKTANGDGTRKYMFAFTREIKEVAAALERRYEFDNCVKKYGRAKVALCVAATIIRSDFDYRGSQIEWAGAVMGLWTNAGPGVSKAIIQTHPAILSDNSMNLRRITAKE
jgi:hypothetical protein